MRTLPTGLITALGASGQAPKLQVTAQDFMLRWSTISSTGAAGRTTVLLSSTGVLLIAVTAQGANPNPIKIRRVVNPATAAQWSTDVSTVTTGAIAMAGCGLSQSGGTTRCFYQRNSDSNIVFRDSTDDGLTWGAEISIIPALDPLVGILVHGIASDDPTRVWIAQAYYPNNNDTLALSIYNPGPAVFDPWTYGVGPFHGWIRGIMVDTHSTTRQFAGGYQVRAGLSGTAATTFSWDGTTYSSLTSVQPMDNPDLGFAASWPSIHYDAANTRWLYTVQLADDGSVSGTPSNRTQVYLSTDGVSFTPYAAAGSSLAYGAHAMWLSGKLYVFDGKYAYTPIANPGALDLSDDVLSIQLHDTEDAPSTFTLTLDNTAGLYTSHASVRADARIRVYLGYGADQILTHDIIIDTIEWTDTADSQHCIIQGRDIAKLLDYPSSRHLFIANKTIGQLITEIAKQAGIPLAALPGTTQFSTALPCFSISAGETWLSALRRLSSIFLFTFLADQTPQLRVIDKDPADASVWSYGSEIIAASFSQSADQANHIRVVGADTVGNAVAGQAIDGSNMLTTGQERYRHVVDRLIDTAPKCTLKATQLLHDEQRQATAAQLIVPLNPGLQVGDVVALTNPQLALVSSHLRIDAISWDIDFETATVQQLLECTGP